MTDLAVLGAVMAATALSFFVSASAGLGGSLILVPTMMLMFGTKEGVALAALLLAGNNVVKVVAYRRVVPIRAAMLVAAMTFVGSFAGARLLVYTSDWLIASLVITSFAFALVAQRREFRARSEVLAPLLALGAGASSGVSGTSGPLKGVAIRSLSLDRLQTVGAAAMVSLIGDSTKTVVFVDAGLLTKSSALLALSAAPIMIVATLAGRRFNGAIGERGYDRLFWGVMGGYTVRLVLYA